MINATWEGSKVSVARIKNGKVVIEPFRGGREKFLRESYKYPIGLIITHDYDTGGKGGYHPEDRYVYYKGMNAEVLGAKDLDHPHITELEHILSLRDEDVFGDLAPGVKYERPDVDQYSFRKKKTAKPKKRLVKKVVKKCKCK